MTATLVGQQGAVIHPLSINRPIVLDLVPALQAGETLTGVTATAVLVGLNGGSDTDVTSTWMRSWAIVGNTVQMLVGNANSIAGRSYRITVVYTTSLGRQDEETILLPCVLPQDAPQPPVTALRCTYIVQGTPSGSISEQLLALPSGQPVNQALGSAEQNIAFAMKWPLGGILDPSDYLVSIISITVADISVNLGGDVNASALLVGQALSAPDTVVFILGDGVTALAGHSYHVTTSVLTASGQVLVARTPPIVVSF